MVAGKTGKASCYFRFFRPVLLLCTKFVQSSGNLSIPSCTIKLQISVEIQIRISDSAAI